MPVAGCRCLRITLDRFAQEVHTSIEEGEVGSATVLRPPRMALAVRVVVLSRSIDRPVSSPVRGGIGGVAADPQGSPVERDGSFTDHDGITGSVLVRDVAIQVVTSSVGTVRGETHVAWRVVTFPVISVEVVEFCGPIGRTVEHRQRSLRQGSCRMRIAWSLVGTQLLVQISLLDVRQDKSAKSPTLAASATAFVTAGNIRAGHVPSASW